MLKEWEKSEKPSEEEIKARLEAVKEKLARQQLLIKGKKVPVLVVLEGWGTAGKGYAIGQIIQNIDPRFFKVVSMQKKTEDDKRKPFLYRHFAIFDRTWYGRVMVERLEGFCSENDWMRAYNEINEFEKELHDWGAVIIKFWVQIDKDTQLARFTDRQNTPEKQWKITEEDWRNRDKWDAYEGAVNEMIQKTSTTYAPWHILESVDKKYARIKALRIVIAELEKVLD